MPPPKIMAITDNKFRGQFDVSNSVNSTSIYTSKFQYAHGLIHSEFYGDISEGIKLLKALLTEHKSDVHAQRDYGNDKINV